MFRTLEPAHIVVTTRLALPHRRASAVIVLITTIFYGSLVNWMGLPAQFIGRMAADVVVTWSVVALVMAFIIRPRCCCAGTKDAAACSCGNGACK